VVRSGLEDLDETAKAAITKALRDAGVEKEIHFSPHGVLNLGGGKVMQLQHGSGAHAVFTDEGGTSVKVMNNGNAVWVEKEKKKEKEKN